MLFRGGGLIVWRMFRAGVGFSQQTFKGFEVEICLSCDVVCLTKPCVREALEAPAKHKHALWAALEALPLRGTWFLSSSIWFLSSMHQHVHWVQLLDTRTCSRPCSAPLTLTKAPPPPQKSANKVERFVC